MDALEPIVTAIATGAAAGASGVATQAFTDAYAALKRLMSTKYSAVATEVEGLESDPEEPLRRQLLAKQLSRTEASADQDLRLAAQEVLRQVAEHAPEAARVVGVRLERLSTEGDVTIRDVAVLGSIGISATDIHTSGSLQIDGVRAQHAEPPHPERGAAAGAESAAPHFTTTSENVRVGRDYINQFHLSTSAGGGNAGRVRAITASVAILPLGDNLWTVTVSNGSAGPITDLFADVYVADQDGQRTSVRCAPARDGRTAGEAISQFMSQGLSGILGPLLTQASRANPWSPGIGPAAADMMAGHMSSRLNPAIQRELQAYMAVEFPSVLAMNDKAEVVYECGPFDRSAAQLEVDITFADEDGITWNRKHGQLPARAS